MVVQTIDDRYQVTFIDTGAFQPSGDVEHRKFLLTSLSRRGDGKTTPIRVIYRVYDMDDNIVLEIDPDPETKPKSLDKEQR